MNKLSIVLLLVATICSCYAVSDRNSVRSASEAFSKTNPIATFTDIPQDSAESETVQHHLFVARGNKNRGGHKNNKMELMHMGLSYIKMVLSTFMSAISHIFAFKSVSLTLISVLIQIAQFIMALKKHKDSQPPPTYKIVETPWHTPVPPENYGAYGNYGHAKSSNNSPYGQQKRR